MLGIVWNSRRKKQLMLLVNIGAAKGKDIVNDFDDAGKITLLVLLLEHVPRHAGHVLDKNVLTVGSSEWVEFTLVKMYIYIRFFLC